MVAGQRCSRPSVPALQYDGHGCNFLHNAIQVEDVESVMFLLSVHVDVNSKVRNQSVHTPLHLAVKKGSELLVRHLVSPLTHSTGEVWSPDTRVTRPAAGRGQGDRCGQALPRSPAHGCGREFPCYPQCFAGEQVRS